MMTLRFPVPVCLRVLFMAGGLLLAGAAHAFEPFVVQEIRVEGLQRIAVGTVFNYLPVQKGDRLDEHRSSEAIRSLFKTGFFKDVFLERDGNVLVVVVQERPAIASITIEGNDAIPTEQLKTSLKMVGLAEGRVFERLLLDRVQQELQRQYLALGKYAARVSSEVSPQERNRVAVTIRIAEGEAATIRNINIVGNKVFSDRQLLGRFELGVAPPFAMFYSGDQYSKQKLAGDLETLRSYYLDRGYINFNIESTQVSITPDKQDVYITINIAEGDLYTLSDVKVAGKTVLGEEEVQKLIALESGEVFSRRAVAESVARIGDRLGEVGYAFANVNPVPDINEKDKSVALTFFVDPGQRVYVRRINITGNMRTNDEVLRREIRQMEGAPLETALVTRSRTRLNRLGLFDSVNVETPPVPGTPDMVDVNFDVDERDTFGSFNFGIGYGDTQGLLFNTGITQENFLGTGNRFNLNLNNSQVTTEYSFSYTNPYATLDGVSRSWNVFYRATDPTQANIGTSYTTDTYGAGVNYGVPLSEFNTFRYGLSAEHTRINTTDYTSQAVLDFCSNTAPGANCSFDNVKGTVSWVFDSRDRTIFATQGSEETVSAALAAPAGKESIAFYKTSLNYRSYLPLEKKHDYVLQIGADVSYGDGLQGLTELPPFEKYYAGGARTVRGYRGNSLGPIDQSGNFLGGNARVLGNMELILPSPFSENSTSTRLSLFVDGGNVFDRLDSFSSGDLRYSAGVALQWITPIGPLSFNLAQPLNRKPGDRIENFQFTLGAPL